MDMLDKKLYRDLEEKIDIPKKCEIIIKEALYKNKTKSTIHKFYMIRTCSIAFMIAILGTGIVYAGSLVHTYIKNSNEHKYTQNLTKKIYPTGGISNQYSGMEYLDGIYYKKITSYNEYLEYKKEKNQILKMEEKEFENYFLLLVEFDNTISMKDFYISNITSEDKNLYIELDRYAETPDENFVNYINSIKILKNENIEKIVVKKNELVPTSGFYKSLEDLPREYSPEVAILDKCFVLDGQNNIISSNKDQMNEFIVNSQKGKESFIRIVHYYKDYTKIVDIEYKNGKYIVCQDGTRCESGKRFYDVRTKLEKYKNYENNEEISISVYLTDDYNRQLPICYFKYKKN